MNHQFEWMLKPTAHETWVRGSGIIVWLSFAFGLAGAGSYLVSLFFGGSLALLISWAIVTVLKNLLHLLHAKRPLGMWRIVLRPGTSWIARGTVVTALFSGFGFAQLLVTWFAPGTAVEIVLKALTGLMALGIIIYEGCAIGTNKAIPLWNNVMVPVLFLLWAMVIGFGFAYAADYDAADATTIMRVSLSLLAAVLTFMALYLWGATQAGASGAASVTEIVRGTLAGLFWVLVVLVGVVAPVVILAYGLAADVALGLSLVIVALLCETIGAGMFLYCVLRAGKYRPVVS